MSTLLNVCFISEKFFHSLCSVFIYHSSNANFASTCSSAYCSMVLCVIILINAKIIFFILKFGIKNTRFVFLVCAKISHKLKYKTLRFKFTINPADTRTISTYSPYFSSLSPLLQKVPKIPFFQKTLQYLFALLFRFF